MSVPIRQAASANNRRLGTENENQIRDCRRYPNDRPDYCSMSDTERFEEISGGWGGFNRSLTAATMEPDRLSNEVLSFAM